jgi:hypothetical protein
MKQNSNWHVYCTKQVNKINMVHESARPLIAMHESAEELSQY